MNIVEALEAQGHSVSGPAASTLLRLVPGHVGAPGFGVSPAIGQAIGAGVGTLMSPAPLPTVGLPPMVGTPIDLNKMLTNAGRLRIGGAQPWTYQSYYKLSSGSAITAATAIQDMFLKANMKGFNNDDQFPSPFLSARLRVSVNSEPVDPGTEDEGFLQGLYVVFSGQTEVARLSCSALQTRLWLSSPPQGTSTGGAFAFALDAHPGVLWPVAYSTTATYKFQFQSDFGIASTSKAISFGVSLDGWTVQGGGTVTPDGKTTDMEGLLAAVYARDA